MYNTFNCKCYLIGKFSGFSNFFLKIIFQVNKEISASGGLNLADFRYKSAILLQINELITLFCKDHVRSNNLEGKGTGYGVLHEVIPDTSLKHAVDTNQASAPASRKRTQFLLIFW